MLESVYHRCMRRELSMARLSFESGKAVDLVYKGVKIGADLRLDLLVEGLVIVELKAIQELTPCMTLRS